NIGGWMQIFALGILVVQITDREGHPELAPFYLGLMGLARALPGIALTLLAGAVADRTDRRRLVMITQSVMALNAAALAAITFAGGANIPVVLIGSAIQSAAFSFDNPARQSMVPRLIPMPMYPSAIGMQSAVFNGASIIGPLLAGLLFIPIGIAGLLAVNAVSFAAMIVAGTLFSTVGPVGQLLPAVAGESLYNGVSWLSLLLTALGLGAFTAALFVMNVVRFRRLGRLFVV